MLLADRRLLADLPHPSADIFAPHAPWCPFSARTLTETLNIDHGLLGVWRLRGVGPQALPAEWTKGHRHAYLVSDVLTWLASRRNEPFDTKASWLDYLAEIHMPPDLIWVPRLAKSVGPVVGDVHFSPAGFTAYLKLLSSQ